MATKRKTKRTTTDGEARNNLPMRVLLIEDYAPLRKALVKGLREAVYAEAD